jgi:hypothetical protein
MSCEKNPDRDETFDQDVLALQGREKAQSLLRSDHSQANTRQRDEMLKDQLHRMALT